MKFSFSVSERRVMKTIILHSTRVSYSFAFELDWHFKSPKTHSSVKRLITYKHIELSRKGMWWYDVFLLLVSARKPFFPFHIFFSFLSPSISTFSQSDHSGGDEESERRVKRRENALICDNEVYVEFEILWNVLNSSKMNIKYQT